MLPKPHRLHRTKDIELVFKKGRGFFSEHFQGKYLKTSEPVPRVAFVVSSKAAKKATKRNWMKRRMRAVTFKNLALLAPADYVISAKPSASKLARQEFNQSFEVFIKSYDKQSYNFSHKRLPKKPVSRPRPA